MSAVQFHRPKTLAEAIACLANDEGAKPLAGGASMVAMMNARLIAPTAIVSLRDISELQGITRNPDGAVRVGAMARHRDTAVNDALKDTLACVRVAAANIANPPVRNMGTMGGSISLADPAADYPPALVAARAQIEIVGPAGTRSVPAADFFTDWYTTVLRPGELVSAILFPAPRSGVGSYLKLARVAGDFAIVSVAISAGANGAVSVAVGGCGPCPIADDEANALLSDHLSDPSRVGSAGDLLAAKADPVDDVRASADYRRRVIPRLLKQAAADALAALENADDRQL